MSEILIRGNPGSSRFELLDGGDVIGQADYRDREGEPPLRIFYHTVVNDVYGGQGLAGKLAARALADTTAAGLVIVPVCPYIRKYLEKHPEYAKNVVAPTPEIIRYLRET